jgi:glycosyltransferase involved in cell wall biosynthesis
MAPFVTFIIPTLGRPTLKRSLDSLYAQTDEHWAALVIGDGNNPARVPGVELENQDLNRIAFFCPEEIFESAGLARNWGLSLFESYGPDAIPGHLGEWIAFLDDDDHLEPTYVEHLRQHAEDYPWAKVIVFRMKHPYLGVLPRPDGRLAWGHVGISYAVARDAIAGHEFEREEIAKGHHEDWNMLKELLTRYRAFVSPHIDYVVRDA